MPESDDMSEPTGAASSATELHEVLARGLRTRTDGAGITPGGVLAYGDAGTHVATVPFGHSHLSECAYWPPFTVREDTIYDIASLTKPIATAASFMKLGLDPDAPAMSLLPELSAAGAMAGRVTFAHLLGHTSGWPAHIKFYERLRAGERAGAASARAALYAMVTSTALVAEPGTRERYSDLGYIALGLAIERATGKRLDRAVRELVLDPLGMAETRYIDLTDNDGAGDGAGGGVGDSVSGAGADDGASGDDRTGEHRSSVPRARIAPTELCPYRGLVHGRVHDDNAHAGGGIFGHAGLFSTASDLSVFARAALSWLGGRSVGGFAPELARRFATETAGPGAVHTLGWDRPSPAPAPTHTGALWPRDSVGHLGFTGCALWLDPARGRYVALLTNRVHPSRDVVGIREFRGAVMDAVVRELDRRG